MELYMRDDRLKFTPPNFWEISEANKMLDTQQLQQSQVLHEVLLRIPFILTFENRVRRLQRAIEEDKQGQNRNPGQLYIENAHGDLQVDPNRVVEVRRKNELQDALDQLEFKNIKALFHVRFINEYGIDEVGIDGGGITKEFIMRVIK